MMSRGFYILQIDFISITQSRFMKTKPTIIIGACLILFSVILSSYVTKETLTHSRTEEYAIVDVYKYGKTINVRVTKGDQPSEETKWEKTKTTDRDDYTPVVKILNTLNEEGFELLNSSLAYDINGTVSAGNGFTIGNPSYSFMMVKKIK